MKNKLETQYNPIANEFDAQNEIMNKKSCRSQRKLMGKHVLPYLKLSSRVLDLGCGTGEDLLFFQKKGFTCSGVDTSEEMCTISRQKIQDVRLEDFSKKMSFKNNFFDLVVSKFAMQTAKNILPIHREACRVLKSGGYFCFLVVHPFRQFLEKKKEGKDYFKKEIVDSVLFDGKITVHEPTHIMEEYISVWFLKHFELIVLHEGYEFPAAEQIDGDTYPTYLAVVARKK